MNMGALFNFSVDCISPDDDIKSGDIGRCWPCSLRLAYQHATAGDLDMREANLDWFGEISESL